MAGCDSGADIELKIEAVPFLPDVAIYAVLRATAQELGRLWIKAVDDDTLLIKMITVEDAHRRTGVGSALIQRLRETAASTGIKRIYGELLLREREALVRFYERNGFTVTIEPSGRATAELLVEIPPAPSPASPATDR